ncbi:hypothetical protein SAMN00777080_1733 [Aquiflexum balticum DSM 16537]|uniref:Outer membrane protein beta-barrel domain-containing protein n=1 Tax=Aquiflexum balticum DSM 16537 TaxID=758820 RepID=A0A1W2H3D0_9BACT|nr:hypothetical protein [Aquiflexum balticum]SMD43152.1 hypothetical protein SAMN00777080_1733 [Aquiflexum balticum DSM 16537]
MKKAKKFLLIIFFLGLYGSLQAQREDAGDYEYDQEILVGINKNTNGGLIGGFTLKLGYRIDDSKFQFFGLDLVNVKNPKEVRYQTVLGNSFIFGKSNYLYSIRPYYGREIIVGKKAPQQGVQVSLLGAIGPTIGIIAPYYIEYAVSRVETVREQFDPEVHQSRFNILGPGRVFEGIGESEVAFGANAKVAVNFEFGVFKSNVTGLELGYQLEGFTREIPLMPTTENNQVFQSVYFTFFYGFRR